jgi:hypothetical protein
MVSPSNHEFAPPRQFVLRQAQDERTFDAERFSHGAARLGGLIPRLLGWRPEDFWDATPAELAAILESGEPAGADPLSRSEFEHLLEAERHG